MTRRLKKGEERVETMVEALVEAAPAQAEPLSPVNGGAPKMARGFDRVVERVFHDVDPERDYERLEKELMLRAALSPGHIETALNTAEENARVAHRLYVAAAVAFERFEVESDVVLGALRTEATAALQDEKAAGQRAKAITDADVRDKAAVLHPDEWRDRTEERAKAEYAVKHLERLADLWKQRAYTLSAMLGAGRR